MTFNNDDNIEDIFGVRLIEWCENKSSNDDYGIFEVDEIVLKSLNEREVNINNYKNNYFTNINY